MIDIVNLPIEREHKIVCRISLGVEKGQACAIVCRDADRTTQVLDAVAGVKDVAAGQVSIAGVDLYEKPSAARAHLGYMPAVSPVYGDMTVRSYLKFVADAKELGHRQANEQINVAMKLLNLQEIADHPLGKLSAGVKRRASLAQALIGEPEALLLDEPTAGLDPKEIVELREAIRAVAKEHAVLIGSHNLSEVCRVCDTVCILTDKGIVAKGSPAQLHEMTVEADGLECTLLGTEAAAREALKGLTGAEIVSVTASQTAGALDIVLHTGEADLREALFRACAEKNVPILRLTRAQKGLDEFLLAMDSDAFAPTTKEGEGQ